jgi:hypothetical protein
MYTSRMMLKRWARLDNRSPYGMTPKRWMVLIGSTAIGTAVGLSLMAALFD